MKKLRILHISDGYPGISDEVGGAEMITQRLVRLFQRRGWQQGVLVANLKSRSGGGQEHGVEFFCGESLEDSLPDISWINALKAQLLPLDPFAARAIQETLVLFHPDLVVLHNIRRFGLQSAAICHQARVPVCSMVYDYSHFCPTGMFVNQFDELCRTPGECCGSCHRAQASQLIPWSTRLLPIRNKLFHPLLKAVDCFICLSQASQELLGEVGVGPERLRVIHQPLLTKGEQKATVREGTDHILFVGWGQKRKGLLVAAKALALVRKPFTFEAIGALVDGPYIDQVRMVLKSGGIDPKQALRGRLSDEELHQSLQKARIVIIAEQWENMSPVFLHEAMALGKTVVAGAIGGIPEFIRHGETGFLVPHDEPKAFGEVLEEILGDNERLAKIGAQAVLAARYNTDYERIVGEYSNLFQKLMGTQYNHRLAGWLSGGTCVVICGGQGSRLASAKKDLPKSLVPINEQSILEHILDFWAPYAGRFLLITNAEAAEPIRQAIAACPKLCDILVEKQTRGGVAAALQEAESQLTGRFVMVLGDCVYKGPVEVPVAMDRGVAMVCGATDELIAENFSVCLSSEGQIERMIEKDPAPMASLCGMGVYFLDGAVWRALGETELDSEGRLQITAVMQTLADTVGLFPVRFDGGYVNVNYPSDLEKAADLLG